MISLDVYLEAFIVGNLKTLALLFGVLIGLAKVSPWTWDEKVLQAIVAPFQALFGGLSQVKSEKKPVETPKISIK